MTNLRTLAHGKSCTVRLPNCAGDGETVYLAHFRLLPYCGTGIKPDDLAFGAWACHNCASASGEGAPLENRYALALGVMRTIHQLKKMGVVRV